ncbi:unnamed protein product [Hymenolepis diminuta]|uniref:Uncharacterized protein n=1 Tax=Hymenolepis diminuta TaxID=6216 RepID=A0A564YE13_HYMDI|nr:unnamed protein product [Hymenolepis diminuta]
MAAYVKGFAQFLSSTGWIFINSSLQLPSIEVFEHPALGLFFGLFSFVKRKNHLLQIFSFTTSFL